MAYCTRDQVQEEFRSITFSATSVVKDSQVDRFIEEADAEIDARLGTRYDTPITGAAALVIVRSISIGLVAGRVRRILEVKTESKDVNQNVRGGDSEKEARAKLDAIVAGKLVLKDAVLNSNDGVEDYVASQAFESTFKRGEDQW